MMNDESYGRNTSMKRYYNKTSIEHLNDELLFEILCRRTAIRCKTISKLWCSIISDPSFLAKGFSVQRKIKENIPPWTLLLKVKPLVTSYIESQNFLPNNPFEVVSTFKDLVLCLSFNSSTQAGVFIICNPLTKQWIPLPPSPWPVPEKPCPWIGFVCQEGRGFRVIVIPGFPIKVANGEPFRNINTHIYLSETGEWKNINVEIPVQPYRQGCDELNLIGVVCQGRACIRFSNYFGAFNPFDVSPTFGGILRAIGLPLPRYEGRLQESYGKLLVVNDFRILFDCNENCSVQSIGRPLIWKVDVNFEKDEQPQSWELVSILRNKKIKVRGSTVAECGTSDRIYTVLKVHPDNDCWLYLITSLARDEQQLVLCNTRSSILMPLTNIRRHQFFSSMKLDVPWPIPILSTGISL